MELPEAAIWPLTKGQKLLLSLMGKDFVKSSYTTAPRTKAITVRLISHFASLNWWIGGTDMLFGDGVWELRFHWTNVTIFKLLGKILNYLILNFNREMSAVKMYQYLGTALSSQNIHVSSVSLMKIFCFGSLDETVVRSCIKCNKYNPYTCVYVM